MTALSPVYTVGNQIGEVVRLHRRAPPAVAREQTVAMLRAVGIPNPERRVDLYPFEMSGGMRQRVMIAMALVCRPELLIADEPTTALDVTIQAQILKLLKELQRELAVSILLITHDMGVVAQLADDVAVMYLGRIVERAAVRSLLKTPRHPYTSGLLKSLPSLALNKERLPSIPGALPNPVERPAGCPFHPRCPYAEAGRCDRGEPPPLQDLGGGRQAACFRVEEVKIENAHGR
jgi:oligopeptide/dipeptide ABC transporter ATP-binding protein